MPGARLRACGAAYAPSATSSTACDQPRPTRRQPRRRRDASPTIRSGTRTRSSTSCTSAPSTTATATASATSAGLTAEARLPRRTSASPPSGCCRSIRRRCSDDGYDIADYTDVNPAYGTLRDFKALPRARRTRAACASSPSWCSTTPRDQHPWFQRARRAPPGSAARDFYVWSDTPDQLHATRASSSRTSRRRTGRGTRSPRPTTGTASTRHQPDLNFDNPRGPRGDVHEALDFWLDMGVDGLRLDAVPTCTSARARTARTCPRRTRSCKELRAHVDAQLPRPHAAGRGEPVAGGRGRLLRRRRRVPHGVPLPAHAAHVHGAPHGGPLPDRRHPASRRRRSPRTASGRSSCATTTS